MSDLDVRQRWGDQATVSTMSKGTGVADTIKNPDVDDRVVIDRITLCGTAAGKAEFILGSTTMLVVYYGASIPVDLPDLNIEQSTFDETATITPTQGAGSFYARVYWHLVSRS